MDIEQQAICFLEKVDKERDGSMLTMLKNNHAARMTFPTTVNAAYVFAKVEMSSNNARVADSRGILG